VGVGEAGGVTEVGRRVWVDWGGDREVVVGLSFGFTAEVGLSFGFTTEVGLSFGFTTEVGFPWFGFPGVGQDSIVLVLVTVLYSTLVVVFVSKTVTYEITGVGGVVVKGGWLDPLEPVPEGSTTRLGPIETLEPREGLTAGRLLELLGGGWTLLKSQATINKWVRDGLLDIAYYGPSYKLSCAWATAAKKRVKRVP